jgi:DNA-binding response OmpR family regulator
MTKTDRQSRPVALIVEDDDQIASLLTFMIERSGFEVLVARDGRAAQQIVESAPPPTIVILDIMLPYVDGFQLVAMIRKQAGWEDVPIIMLTAKSQERDIVRALDAGANDYIIKPFKPEELKARIKRLVRPET